jgi:NAD(P)-dependent dehydrogenase (short-subunit alcohol dehydrogenase family)
MHVRQLFDLGGKVALVTGGSRGIGKFIATGLAEAGADVVIGSRKIQNCQEVAKELGKLGVRTLAVQCDVAKIEDLEKLVQATLNIFGRIDILVNNSGTTWGAPTLEYPLDKWERTMAINVRGPFLLSQKVAKIMIPQKGGKIINIASTQGLRGADEDIHPAVAYNASKGAVVTLTKDLAIKLAKYNIQVNAIAPGYFATDMLAWVEEDRYKSAKEKIYGLIPMNRMGEEEDIKGLAVFLASAASNFITGEIIRVDGGQLAK